VTLLFVMPCIRKKDNKLMVQWSQYFLAHEDASGAGQNTEHWTGQEMESSSHGISQFHGGYAEITKCIMVYTLHQTFCKLLQASFLLSSFWSAPRIIDKNML
jgi:hypothetical protein